MRIPESTPAPYMPSPLAQQNFRYLVLDIVWFGLALPSTMRFLSVYAIRLDASAALLGYMAALPSLFALLTSSLAGWWASKFKDIGVAQFWPGMGFRLVFLFPFLTPFFPRDWQATWLVIGTTLAALPQGISSVLFLVILRRSVENQQINALTSRRSLAFSVTVAVGTLAFGFWLEVVRFPLNYQVMYVVAFLLSLVSIVYVRRLRVLAPDAPLPVGRPVQRPWRSPGFRGVVIVSVITHVAFFSILPVIPLHMIDKLGADEVFMSLFSLAELGAAAAAAAFSNRLIARLGPLRLIALGMAGTGVAAFIFAFTPTLALTPVAGAISGMCWTATAIAIFGYFSENTPTENLTGFTTVWNQVIMLAIAVGPMLGSQLASAGMSLPLVMVLGAALRLVVGGMILANRFQWMERPFIALGRLRRASQ